MKKLLSVICISTAFSLSAALLSFAAQTDRWHSDSNGTWYLYNEAKTSNVVNSWFQDLDGAWYLLAPGDGHMYAGLIHDTITDKWYFCQTQHDGWYGRMASADGSYTVNGQNVSLAFNQNHDGTFGAITSGLDELKSTGVVSQDIAGIPADSASAVPTDNETVPEQGNNSSATESYIDWHVDGDVLKIEGSGDMPNIEFEQVNGVITIPKPPWNDYADHVTRIEIGEGITSVGDYAFMQFKKVRSVQLPSSLTRIGIEPFYMCWLLSDIAIPPSVTSIGEYAFYDCNLSGIEIPSGVTSIGEKTFYNNPKMEYVELPAALKTIGEDAFHFCFALKEVVIPDGTTSIDRFAFQDCTSLERVTIPASVTEINEYAFAGCNSLTDIYYGGSAEMWDKLLEKDFMPTVNVTVHYNAQ